jgi:hypothetical protein
VVGAGLRVVGASLHVVGAGLHVVGAGLHVEGAGLRVMVGAGLRVVGAGLRAVGVSFGMVAVARTHVLVLCPLGSPRPSKMQMYTLPARSLPVPFTNQGYKKIISSLSSWGVSTDDRNRGECS